MRSDIPSFELERALSVAVVVAHPDNETLWAGGLLLSHPEWSPFIVTLCRGEDPDWASKFRKALAYLGAEGAMGILDDGPDQFPLSSQHVKEAILALLPKRTFDIVLTHAPQGEYTWHRRHGEVSRAVQELWRDEELVTRSLWLFAYEDGGGAYAPRPQEDTPFLIPLPEEVLGRKNHIIRDVYEFEEASWEARAVTRAESFHCFSEPASIHVVAENGRVLAH